MTAGAGQPADPAEVEVRYQHLTTRSFRASAHELRQMFGLGGTPADDLVDRLVALLDARPHLLAGDEVEASSTWEADLAHRLLTIEGMTPGEAAEHLRVAELAPLTSARVWEAEPDGRDHPRCGPDCADAGVWGATRIMPSGHYWQWTDEAHTGGYLAHRTSS